MTSQQPSLFTHHVWVKDDVEAIEICCRIATNLKRNHITTSSINQIQEFHILVSQKKRREEEVKKTSNLFLFFEIHFHHLKFFVDTIFFYLTRNRFLSNHFLYLCSVYSVLGIPSKSLSSLFFWVQKFPHFIDIFTTFFCSL